MMRRNGEGETSRIRNSECGLLNGKELYRIRRQWGGRETNQKTRRGRGEGEIGGEEIT